MFVFKLFLKQKHVASSEESSSGEEDNIGNRDVDKARSQLSFIASGSGKTSKQNNTVINCYFYALGTILGQPFSSLSVLTSLLSTMQKAPQEIESDVSVRTSSDDEDVTEPPPPKKKPPPEVRLHFQLHSIVN